MSPKNDNLETKCVQIYKKINIIKPVWMAFGHFFSIKSGRGMLIREGAFIRINTAY